MHMIYLSARMITVMDFHFLLVYVIIDLIISNSFSLYEPNI